MATLKMGHSLKPYLWTEPPETVCATHSPREMCNRQHLSHLLEARKEWSSLLGGLRTAETPPAVDLLIHHFLWVLLISSALSSGDISGNSFEGDRTRGKKTITPQPKQANIPSAVEFPRNCTLKGAVDWPFVLFWRKLSCLQHLNATIKLITLGVIYFSFAWR